ncbi:MAG TPA: T9SS type A sorting domain-containing protein, partial [Bacteroidia bacterium]
TWINEKNEFFDGICYFFKDNHYIFSGGGKLPYISGLKGCFKLTPSTYTEGYAYFDINGNCNLDAQDSLLRNHWVNIADGSKNYRTISNQNGWYEMPITAGNYTYSTGVVNFKLASCGTDTLKADSFISYNRNIAYDFKSPYDYIGDIEVSAAGGIMRRGNAYTLYLKLKNLGNTPLTINPKVKFDPKLKFTSSNYSINKSLSDQLEFAPVTVKVFEDQKVIIHFYVHQDSVETNDVLTFTASTDLTNNEVTHLNNQDIYKETVMGPYDPNAIHGNPENKVWTSPKTIKYTIEFQNLGSDTAFNVRIEDIMPSGLDLSNIDIIEHSGPSIYTMVEDRNIKFYLNSQRLTPSSKDVEKSKGYIIFTIPVTDSLSIGESFDNLAGIYFDYEARINTNVTSVLRVKEGTSIDEISSRELPISIYPNPGSQILNLESQFGDIQNFNVYNVAGQSIFSGNGNQSIDVSNWNSGIYMLVIEFEGRHFTVMYNKL